MNDIVIHSALISVFDKTGIADFAARLAEMGVEIISSGKTAKAIEMIDIGGPAMVRAAAKNHKFVTVVTDPSQYEPVLNEMRSGSLA